MIFKHLTPHVCFYVGVCLYLTIPTVCKGKSPAAPCVIAINVSIQFIECKCMQTYFSIGMVNI